MKRSRRPFLGLGLLLLSCLAGFGAVEAAVRFCRLVPSPWPVAPAASADVRLPYRSKPNASWISTSQPVAGEYEFEIKTKSLGFRDEEHQVPKRSGTFRILGLGSSAVMGAGAAYEDAFLTRLERRLNSGAPHYEVIKAARANFKKCGNTGKAA